MLNLVWLFGTPSNVALQAPLSVHRIFTDKNTLAAISYSRDIPDTGTECAFLTLPCMGRQILYHCAIWGASLYIYNTKQHPWKKELISQAIKIKQTSIYNYSLWKTLLNYEKGKHQTMRNFWKTPLNNELSSKILLKINNKNKWINEELSKSFETLQ